MYERSTATRAALMHHNPEPPEQREARDSDFVECRKCGESHWKDDIGEIWCYQFLNDYGPGEVRCMDTCLTRCVDCEDELVQRESEYCKTCAEMALCGY